MNNPRIILFLMLLILFLPGAFAASTNYLTEGVDNQGSFQSEGTGVWTGREAVTATNTGNFTGTPLVYDVDNDGINEIIAFKDANLLILNYTKGVGLLEEASYTLSSRTYHTGILALQTPGLLDYDLDNITEIIVFEVANMTVLEYNGNGSGVITTEKTNVTGLGTGSGNVFAPEPVIKCADNLNWADNKDRCVMYARHRNASGVYPTALSYNLDDGALEISVDGGALPNDDADPGNTHLIDGTGDASADFYYRYRDAANDDIRIYRTTVDATGTPTITLHATQSLGATGQYTDILVGNFDGNTGDGLEVAWGYTSDGTNWLGRIIDRNAVVLLDDTSVCTTLTCPEGESASFNMFTPDTSLYGVTANEACYYIRNANNNDPGENTDTIHCMGLSTGIDVTETTVTNTANFTGRNIVHYNRMYGSVGLLTQGFGISGSTKQSNPTLLLNDIVYPVDYERDGSVDLLAASQTALTYYDDANVNQNIQIDKIVRGTGNPVCQNVILVDTLTLSDNESNNGQCHIQELFPNGTQAALHSNTTVVTPSTIQLTYLADTVGSFYLDHRCRDTNHDTWTTRRLVVDVSNDTTTCNLLGQNPETLDFVPDEEADDSNLLLTQADDVMDQYGIKSSGARNIIVLIAMMIITVSMVGALALKGVGGAGITISVVTVNASLMIIAFLLGWMSAIPLVIMALVLVFAIVAMIFSNSSGAMNQ